MSVINQMLVDLERRRASTEERNRIPSHVRALPGDPVPVGNKTPIIAVAIGIVALAAGGWWWFAGKPVYMAAPSVPVAPVTTTPATTPSAAPSPAVPAADQGAVEMIARRMSMDLAHVPETIAMESEKNASVGVATAKVISRPVSDSAPVAAPMKSRPITVADEPPAAAKKPIVVAEKPAVPPSVEIDKRVRDPTLRQRADAEYSRGVTALHQGRSSDARVAFEAALQIDPSLHSARQALVGVLLDTRQQAEAIRKLQDGLKLAPAQYGFAMALARIQVEIGELDPAAQTLSRSLEFAATNADYIAFYAGLLQRQQKHAEAVEQFQRALRLRSNAGVWLLGLGVSLDAVGRRDEALEAYRRAQATGNLSPELQAFADQRLR